MRPSDCGFPVAASNPSLPWPPTHGTVMHTRRNPFKNPVVFIPSTLALSIAVAIGNYYVIGGLFA